MVILDCGVIVLRSSREMLMLAANVESAALVERSTSWSKKDSVMPKSAIILLLKSLFRFPAYLRYVFLMETLIASIGPGTLLVRVLGAGYSPLIYWVSNAPCS